MAYDKEYMKMAMLRHEETFKEQVSELHRLYRIQKNLMKNTLSSRLNGQNQGRLINSKNETNLNQIINEHHDIRQKLHHNQDLDRPTEEYNAELEVEDEHEIELTLGPSSFYQRRKEDTPLTSDSGPTFSSSNSTGSSHLKRTNSGFHQWGLVEVPDLSPGFPSGRRNSSEEEPLRQDRLNQSPWLFQVLSLNMT